jgi:hypothetical protein
MPTLLDATVFGFPVYSLLLNMVNNQQYRGKVKRVCRSRQYPDTRYYNYLFPGIFTNRCDVSPIVTILPV